MEKKIVIMSLLVLFSLVIAGVQAQIMPRACGSGESLTGSSGFFTSPSFPSNFSQYSNCTWNITVPNGYIIKLTFHHFSLGSSWQGARLTITNVASGNGYQPFQLNGSSLPYPVYSAGNFIQVIFTSQTDQYSGFNASYLAITYDSVCPKLAILNETSGVITSPFYPRNNPDYQRCSWQITASKGNYVVLIIEYMNIRQCGVSCTCDYLKIQNGSSFDGLNPISGRRCDRYDYNRYLNYYYYYYRYNYNSYIYPFYCHRYYYFLYCYLSPLIFHSHRESLKVLFLSDGSSTYSGFKATYVQVNRTAIITACSSGEVLTGSRGTFSSPNFPNNFPNYIRCTWNITVPSGYIIKLSFHNFTLGYPARNGSRLTITNVASDDGYRPFFLFRDYPPPVYSAGNFFQVIFMSLSGQYSGFNASYTAITFDSVCPRSIILNETTGVITSPFYPRSYPDNQACSWKITARKGHRVVLTIEYLQIQRCGVSCTCDYLQIINGSYSNGTSSGKMCGNVNMTSISIQSFDESLEVVFVSDGGYNKRSQGFKANYVQVNSDTVSTATSKSPTTMPGRSSTSWPSVVTSHEATTTLAPPSTSSPSVVTSQESTTTPAPPSTSSPSVITSQAPTTTPALPSTSSPSVATSQAPTTMPAPSSTSSPSETPPEKKFRARISVDEIYKSAYVNLNSEESRAFISNFKRNVEPIFRAQLSNFERLDVISLSSGSVVVDFDIVVQKSSNATEDNVVGVLIEANSTGSLGYRLTGEITVEELRNVTSTNTAEPSSPTTLSTPTTCS